MIRIVNAHPVQEHEVLVACPSADVELGADVARRNDPGKSLNAPKDVPLAGNRDHFHVPRVHHLHARLDLFQLALRTLRDDDFTHLDGLR